MQNIDCSKCENRGRIDGLSQETFCDSCIHYGNQWKKDHFKEKGTNEMMVIDHYLPQQAAVFLKREAAQLCGHET